MPASNVCWGIEIGAGAIKALKLVKEGDHVTVADFAVVAHARPLSTPDIDPKDAIRVALGALVNQHDLTKASIAISVPGHASFARFAKLPPVEPKKVPDIVKFEAVQQIPFPIDEVEWDYQTFVSSDSPDIEVGIFAITRERVMERLEMCRDVNLQPDLLNISPVALYNAVAYDHSFTEQTPGTVIVDIGTTATDLIVADAGRVWIRTFPLGGHHFTEALVEAFKLPYAKAEKLKREAEMSTHKRQIFQAMKPVFADLAQDVQRSISYYQQLHPSASLKRLLGAGSTFRLMGLRKFLSQQLQMDAARLDKHNRLNVEGAKASDFQGVALTMGTAYGLALQGLGMGAINANLIPRQVIREAVWQKKTPWFVAAAVTGLAAGAISFYRPITDKAKAQQAESSGALRAVADLKREGDVLIKGWRAVEEGANIGYSADNVMRLAERRDAFARMVDDVGRMLASADPQPALLTGNAADVPPEDRRLFNVRALTIEYVTPSGAFSTGPTTQAAGAKQGPARPRTGRSEGGGMGSGLSGMTSSGAARESRRRGSEAESEEGGASANPLGSFQVSLVVDATNAGRRDFVDRTLLKWLRDNADRPDVPYKFITGPVDTMVVEQDLSTERSASTRPAPGAGAGAHGAPTVPAAGGRPTVPGAGSPGTSRPGTASGGDTPGSPTSIDEIAPLPPAPPNLEEGAKAYRYRIEWQAVFRAPGGAGGEGDQGGGRGPGAAGEGER